MQQGAHGCRYEHEAPSYDLNARSSHCIELGLLFEGLTIIYRLVYTDNKQEAAATATHERYRCGWICKRVRAWYM